LLVYLALHESWVDRRELAQLYRQDAPETEALAYLRKLVFRARQYEWAADLEVAADALRWSVRTDVAQFDAAVEKRDWSTAVAAFGGAFLGGARLSRAPGFAAWQEAEEAALGAALLRSRSGLARLYEDAGRLEDAAELHKAMLDADPFAEASVQALLRLLSAVGRRQEAFGIYESFRLALADELGAAPLEGTEALADELRGPTPGTGDQPTKPVPASVDDAGPAPRAALPTPGTPFVGRRQELRELRRLLRNEGARLVTIVGLGGSGKTRLAIEAAAAESAGGRQAEFVTLAAADSADGVAPLLVEALGLPWEGGDAERSLLEGLQARELLLVLDNFENVIAAAPLVGRLLTQAPALSLIVTSREPLKVHGEWLLDIGGLEAPPEEPGAEVQKYDSVRLYVQQAARLTPGLRFTTTDLADVGQICRKLDGLPLAIELAASWSPLLSAGEVLLEVDRDPRILVSQQRNVPERHKSLWAIFDYTWERLSPPEQAALIALTVFPAGFGLKAARTVAGSDLASLLRLMDLKLLRRTGEGRFELHQLVKQYAEQRSAAGAEVERAREAHSKHYCSYLKELTPDLKGNDVHAGLSAVQAELPNVLAAWRHAVTRADHHALDAARDAVDHYFYYRADFGTASRLFATAAESLTSATSTGEPQADVERVIGRLQVHLSEHERHRSQLTLSLDIANQALERLEAAGTEADVAYARLNLGTGLMRVSAYSESEPLIREVLAFALRSGDLYLQGATHNILANLVSYTERNVAVAEEHYRASLEANQELGNLEGINGALINLGACRYDLRDFEGAMQLWQEAAAMAEKLGYKQREAVLHNNMGSVYEALGRLSEAEERYRLSLSLRRDIDDRSGQANALHNLGRLAAERGDLAAAERQLHGALNLFTQTEEPAGEAHVRSSLARLLASQGRDQDARTEAHAALALALKLDSRADILGSLLTVALLHEHAGELPRAAELAAKIAEAAAGSLEPLRAEAEKLKARAAEQAPFGAPQQSGAPFLDAPPGAGASSDDELLHVARRELSRFRS